MGAGAAGLRRIVGAVLVAVVAAACGGEFGLAPAPALYTPTAPYPASDVPAHQQTTTPIQFYFTDRGRVQSPNGGVAYGFERSASMAFGAARLRFGAAADWGGLVAASVAEDGGRHSALDVIAREEIVRFPATPLPFEMRAGRPVTTDAAQAAYSDSTAQVHRALSRELARADRPEAVVFIHGFRYSFDEAHIALANIWHYSGRIGVPVLYSWPANNPGLLGYFRDREAGEFSVHHLKEFLRLLAATPGLERIHIVAHSRGTDIATTALREMVIAERGAGRDPRATLKVDTLILAAPDLDFGVVGQRLIAERFGPAFGQINAYLNPDDNRLRLAEVLMAGTRFGRVTADSMDARAREVFTGVDNVHFINVAGATGRHRHSYFLDNPNVLSDIVLTLRTRAPPGGDERPLQPDAGNFWRLPPWYPGAPPPEPPETDPRR